MEIVFITSYYNHHQAALAKCLDIQTGHCFTFIETEPMSAERKNMGWSNEDVPAYVKKAYASEHDRAECQKLIHDADVVIWGSCPFSMIQPRLKEKKLSFCYSERLFKKGFGPIAFGGRAVKYWLKHWRYQKNHYLLCASAYAAGDYAKIGLFRNQAYKWGYFPEYKEIGNVEEVVSEKQENSLLWAGRMIDWKHPEIPIRIAKRLKDDGYQFQLNMIGNGDQELLVKQMIEEFKLSECVHMHGAMSPKNVRKYMERSEIYLFTSDHNEGWGVVMNEAMNSCCAVIANRQIGSAPYLIHSGENGLLYNGENELYQMVTRMLNNKNARQAYGVQAYKTVKMQWSAELAAARLYELACSLQNGNVVRWESGPCSKA